MLVGKHEQFVFLNVTTGKCKQVFPRLFHYQKKNLDKEGKYHDISCAQRIL